MAAAIKSAVMESLWRRASAHHLGAGLEQGVDLTQARRLLRRYRRVQDHQRAQLLLTILAGGMWPLQRCCQEGYHGTDLCPLCGLQPETVHHLCWSCPAVKRAGIPEVERSRHLEEALRAAQPGDDGHLFWARGLTPLGWLGLPQPPSDYEIKLVGCAESTISGDKLDVSGMVIYLDESGGVHAADPRLRRAGWGLVALPRAGAGQRSYCDRDLTQLGAWYGSVPGDVQTPPRAALMALVQVLSTTSGDLLVKPDASYLVDGISKGRHLNAQGTHADLWYQVGRLMAARGAPQRSQRSLPSWTTSQSFRGRRTCRTLWATAWQTLGQPEERTWPSCLQQRSRQ